MIKISDGFKFGLGFFTAYAVLTMFVLPAVMMLFQYLLGLV